MGEIFEYERSTTSLDSAGERFTAENGSQIELERDRTKLLNVIDHPICTRIPFRYDVMSAWAGHVPFAMYLVDIAKPCLLVELGSHWGLSYCAFCQAVKELGLPTECYAIDTWEGDPHASFYTTEVFDDLKAYHDGHYSLFSKLLRSTFDNALVKFKDKSIDVLHIDGYHTYEAVSHDFEKWLPKLSDRGLILFHDTNVRDRETFGVWRFWDEIKNQHPSFEFLHSYGLGVLAVGRRIPKELEALFNSSSQERMEAQQFFANLGGHLVELQTYALQAKDLRELLDAKTNECVSAETACTAAAK